jgi:hypothetical protein
VGRFTEAIEILRNTVQRRESISRGHPEIAANLRDYAISLAALADVQAKGGDHAHACQLYPQARAVHERLPECARNLVFFAAVPIAMLIAWIAAPVVVIIPMPARLFTALRAACTVVVIAAARTDDAAAESQCPAQQEQGHHIFQCTHDFLRLICRRRSQVEDENTRPAPGSVRWRTIFSIL